MGSRFEATDFRLATRLFMLISAFTIAAAAVIRLAEMGDLLHWQPPAGPFGLTWPETDRVPLLSLTPKCAVFIN